MAVIIQTYDEDLLHDIMAMLIISYNYESMFDAQVRECINNNNFEEFCSHKYIINSKYINDFTVTKQENGKESICCYATIIKVGERYSFLNDCTSILLSDEIMEKNTIDNKIIELSEVTTQNNLSLIEQAITRVCNNDAVYCRMMRRVQGNNNFEVYISPYDKQKIVTNNIHQLFMCEYPGQYIIALNRVLFSSDVGYISLPDDFNIQNDKLHNKIWFTHIHTRGNDYKLLHDLKSIMDTISK